MAHSTRFMMLSSARGGTHNAIGLMTGLFVVCAGGVVAHATPRPPPPTPDEIFHHAVNAAWKDMDACNKDPKLVGEVTVRRKGRSWRLDPSQSLGKAGLAVAECVRDALAKQLERSFHGSGQHHTHRIGTAVSVLPPPSKVIAAWQRGRRDGLKELLPPDHSLTTHLCIRADRGYAETAMSLWMPSVGEWVPRMWEELMPQALGHPVSAAMWHPSTTAFVTLSPRGLCYEPVDAAKLKWMRVQMDLAGTCLAGGFDDVLLHPRLEFPKGKKYTHVSVNHDRACALSTTGDITCCGGIDPAMAAAPTGIVSFELGGTFGCGLDAKGAIKCWGAIAAPPSGEFTSLGAGHAHACAVGKDGRLACWGAANYDLKTPPPGKFVGVSVAQEQACGLKTDGTPVCWGRTGPRPPPGAFTAIESDWTHACAIRLDGTIGCWNELTDQVQSPLPDRVDQIAVGDLFEVCGRRLDKTIRCGALHTREPAKVKRPPAGTFAQIDGSRSMYCGVRDNGTVECWGTPWPGTWAGDNTWPYTLQLFGHDFTTVPLAGRVLDENGTPISGAEVLPCGETANCIWVEREARRRSGTLKEVLTTMRDPPADDSYTLVATTADGRFSQRVPMSRQDALFTAPGRELVVQSLYDGMEVMLRPVSTIEIEARYGSRDCGGKLRVSLSEHEHRETPRLEHVLPGSYNVLVTANWGEPGECAARKVIDVPFAASSIKVGVALRKTGTGKSISGTIDVQNPESRPISVAARCGDVYRAADVDIASGAFEITDVGPPPCDVTFATNAQADKPAEITQLPATRILLRGRLISPPRD